ncbi:uncharacterized protein BDR25DRAFT_392233 [Lindgomyces ingoldianus]|uniref:Uncharacterized protein n=1 Tax=Lindgomyces ingoldianus TaxID=673940 RepID=A0ACB6R671_9PLEO|nr:uncharacterized protein BDR25DRAFT_392233 [Lindgomyces ingoldianus]KAF2473797.1 hypothetical protein BDR25DRAFT_392233 [Lindgomyces ingoldianus]
MLTSTPAPPLSLFGPLFSFHDLPSRPPSSFDDFISAFGYMFVRDLRSFLGWGITSASPLQFPTEGLMDFKIKNEHILFVLCVASPRFSFARVSHVPGTSVGGCDTSHSTRSLHQTRHLPRGVIASTAAPILNTAQERGSSPRDLKRLKDSKVSDARLHFRHPRPHTLKRCTKSVDAPTITIRSTEFARGDGDTTPILILFSCAPSSPSILAPDKSCTQKSNTPTFHCLQEDHARDAHGTKKRASNTQNMFRLEQTKRIQPKFQYSCLRGVDGINTTSNRNTCILLLHILLKITKCQTHVSKYATWNPKSAIQNHMASQSLRDRKHGVPNLGCLPYYGTTLFEDQICIILGARIVIVSTGSRRRRAEPP